MRLMIKASAAAASEQSRGTRGGMARYAPINALRAQALAGMGEINAVQLAVRRMERTTTETADLPRIVHEIGDVTRGLGLAKADETTIQRAVSGTSAEYNPKTQTQRLFLARGMLGDLLRSMKAVPGDARQEIARRATAWWQKQAPTELDRPARLGISYARSMNKAGTVARWITVSGARIPIGADGKMMGNTGKKLMLHAKKKGGDGGGRSASEFKPVTLAQHAANLQTRLDDARRRLAKNPGDKEAKKQLDELERRSRTSSGLQDQQRRHEEQVRKEADKYRARSAKKFGKSRIVFPLSVVAPDMV